MVGLYLLRRWGLRTITKRCTGSVFAVGLVLSSALRISRGVSQGIHKSMVQSGGEFLNIGVAGRPGETL